MMVCEQLRAAPARRERVGCACAVVAPFAGRLAESRVRRVVLLAKEVEAGVASVEALAEEVRQLRLGAEHARRRASVPVWTVSEAWRVASAAGEYRAALTVAEEIDLALGPVACFPRPGVAFNPAWRTTTALALARLVAAGQTNLLPILADALEDAGCSDAAILDHCRERLPTEHASDCWVIELILGRSGGDA